MPEQNKTSDLIILIIMATQRKKGTVFHTHKCHVISESQHIFVTKRNALVLLT